MGTRDVEGDAEAETHATFAFGEKGIPSAEQGLRGKTGAGVEDFEAKVSRIGLKREADFTASRGRLQRIEDEVGESLMEAVGIT